MEGSVRLGTQYTASNRGVTAGVTARVDGVDGGRRREWDPLSVGGEEWAAAGLDPSGWAGSDAVSAQLG